MPRTVRWISAVFGSMKVSESASALATITDFSSGVRYRWCGSLPVGRRLISFHCTGSITLTLASSEFSTNTGADTAVAHQVDAARRTAAQAEVQQEDEFHDRGCFKGNVGLYRARQAFPLTSRRWKSFRSTAWVSRFNACRARPADRWHQLFFCTKAWARWPCGATGPRRSATETGRAGIVYSRRGYGQSDPVPDVRGAGRLGPDYMHREALEELPALLARAGDRNSGAAGPFRWRHHRPAPCEPVSRHGLRRDGAARDRGRPVGAVDRAGPRRLWVGRPARAAGRATTPTSTAPSGNGTTSGSARRFATSTSGRSAGASRRRCWRSRARTTRTGRCARSRRSNASRSVREAGAAAMRPFAAPRPARPHAPPHRPVPGRPALTQGSSAARSAGGQPAPLSRQQVRRQLQPPDPRSVQSAPPGCRRQQSSA